MKHLALSALAALALLAAPIAAHADGGYAEASIGNADYGYGDLDVVTLGGSADVQVSNNWRAQFDADVNRYSTDYDYDYTSTNAAAHVYYDGGNYAVGAVVGTQDFYYGSLWTIGIEAQATIGNVVLEAEASHGELDGYGDVSATLLDASATWYIQDNLSVLVGVSSLDIGDYSDEFTTWRAEAEYGFTNAPVSVFVNYQSTDIDYYYDNVDQWRVGLRYNFGPETLRARREDGPHWLRNTNALPFFSSPA